MAMTKVAEVVVGSSGSASIEFTNIPQTGKDLLILLSGRSTAASIQRTYRVRANGDSANNYSTRRLGGSGSSVYSGAFSIDGFISTLVGDTATANTFGNGALYISNYTSSVAKSASFDAVDENNATAAYMEMHALSWSGTAAITSLTVLADSGNLAQHSTASLYLVS